MNAVYSQIAVVIAVGIFCLSQIAACGGSPTPAPVVERSDLAPTETEVPSRAAATDIVEPAILTPATLVQDAYTATPIASTPRPTATRRPTPTVTPTPLPTIPPEQIPTILAELGQNGGDCVLPCWWGMTPGTSHWTEFEPFLESLTEISQERRDNPEAVYFIVDANLRQEDLSVVDSGVVSVVDGVVNSIMTGGSSDVAQLRLPEFLATNGMPDEVWLNTYSGPYEGGILPFRLYLIYSRGIIARFELADVPTSDDNVVGCYGPEAFYYILLLLVSPDQQISFQQALLSGTFLDPSQTYLPLEEATNLNIDTFYNEFRLGEWIPCIETPREVWAD